LRLTASPVEIDSKGETVNDSIGPENSKKSISTIATNSRTVQDFQPMRMKMRRNAIVFRAKRSHRLSIKTTYMQSGGHVITRDRLIFFCSSKKYLLQRNRFSFSGILQV